MAGLTSLAVIVGVPLLLGLLGPVLWMVPFTGLLSMLAQGLIGLYAVWYFAECVYDSSRGGTRAPQALDTGGTGEMWSRAAYILLVFILFVGPMMVYFLAIGGRDVILWVLVAWAVVFFPIGLLAMVLHDSLSVLNPLFLLGSVLRAFLPYMGFVLPLAAIVVGLAWLWPPPLVPSIICLAIGPYVMLILAHILGRFYWRNRERLDWGL